MDEQAIRESKDKARTGNPIRARSSSRAAWHDAETGARQGAKPGHVVIAHMGGHRSPTPVLPSSTGLRAAESHAGEGIGGGAPYL